MAMFDSQMRSEAAIREARGTLRLQSALRGLAAWRQCKAVRAEAAQRADAAAMEAAAKEAAEKAERKEKRRKAKSERTEAAKAKAAAEAVKVLRRADTTPAPNPLHTDTARSPIIVVTAL